MFQKNLLIICLMMIAFAANAQEGKRYLEPVFDQVTKQTVIYGYNWTILSVPVTGNATLQPLVGDVYMPTGDTEEQRPLILYWHSGNFLPYPQNQSVSGTRSDSTVVTMCTRLAKMGYVVVSCDNRLGWNPTASTQNERVNTLINAAYRGVQDSRSAIRFFKLQSDAMNIDTNKIVLFGQGTGGYISLNTGTLDSYGKIINTTMPADKFKDGGIPYIFEAFNGNIDGTTYGVLNVPGHPLEGDTLSIPNNVGPSSKFQLMVNLAGAIGDISWLDQNSPAVISFHSPTDPFAPYTSGVLVVPVVNLPVVEVQGSYLIQQKADQLGLNDAFADVDFVDPISLAVKAKGNVIPGLFPIQRPADKVADSSPWDFWDPATNVNHASGLLTNSDMSKEKATAYMDTIIGFFAPRACLVLELPCDYTGLTTKKISAEEAGITAMPNPANDYVTIRSEVQTIKGIVIYDASGRAVKAIPNVNGLRYDLQRNNLPPGVYYAQVRFEKESASVKLIFN